MDGKEYGDEVIYNFQFDRETQEELAEIVAYYNTHPNPENGRRFLTRVETVVEILRTWPEIGTPVEALENVLSFPVPKYPYRLYYTIFRDELEIIGISVYHTKRDLEKLVAKLMKRKSEE